MTTLNIDVGNLPWWIWALIVAGFSYLLGSLLNIPQLTGLGSAIVIALAFYGLYSLLKDAYETDMRYSRY